MKSFKIHSSHLLTVANTINYKPIVLREINNILLKEKYSGITLNVFKYKSELVNISFDKSKNIQNT
jgi:hypothetical protein